MLALLVQVGKFYEACGVDAVMLVEHCGLNFMGDALSAGCPLVNIHKVLQQLVREAGFEVVSTSCPTVECAAAAKSAQAV